MSESYLFVSDFITDRIYWKIEIANILADEGYWKELNKRENNKLVKLCSG